MFVVIFMNLIEKKILLYNYFFFSIKFVNVILNNGIILIHPLCMYITYSFFLILVFLYFKKSKKI